MGIVTPVVRQWIEEGLTHPDDFWARAARELPWFRPWDQVFEWNFPTFRWFVGAETNLAYNALDRHVAGGRGRSHRSHLHERARRAPPVHLSPSSSRWSNGSPPRCAHSASAKAIG